MTSHMDLMDLVKTAGPMVPFLKAVCVYFLLDAHNIYDEYWSTILKCAPIVCLMVFILLQGTQISKKSLYRQNILAALIFSCLGDALLNHNYFIYGMCAFAVTQIFYITAFGFHPLNIWIGILLYIAGSINLLILWKNLDGALLIGFPVYSILLVTMCWRSISLLFINKNSTNILRILCAISSCLFVISDAMIAINKFYMPINNSSIWIMVTYYVAQFGMTLSILDTDKPKPKPKSQNKKSQ